MMNKLILTKKFLRVKDVFIVTNTGNELIYNIKLDKIKKYYDYRITDRKNQELATVALTWKKRLITADLIINREKVCTIQRLKKQNKQNRFIIKALDMEIVNAGSNFSFDVFAKGEKIAEIKKKWIAISDTYHLCSLSPAFDEQMQLMMLFICLVIEKANLTFFSNLGDMLS